MSVPTRGLPVSRYPKRATFLVLLFVLLLAIAAHSAEAGPSSLTLTVDSTLDAVDANPGDGVCATSGSQCTLRAAVQETNAWPGADTILLPAGTYYLTLVGLNEDYSAAGDLDIRDHLALSGAGAAATIVDGIGQDRVFQVLTGSPPGPPINVTIAQVTIRNGAVPPSESGGGVMNQDEGRVTLSNVVVISNTATFGGGVYAHRAMTITESVIRDNSAQFGGGIYNKFQKLTLINSTLSGNRALFGGGINNFYPDTPLRVVGSTLAGNTATESGGGINMETGFLEVVNSTLSGNGASAGGGLNVTSYQSVVIAGSTIVSNTATGGAGGIEAWTPVTLFNSLIAHSLGGPNCSGQIVSLGYNLDSGASCQFTAIGDLSNTPPELGPLQDNGGPTFTHGLLAGSPAIDAGNPAPPGSGGTACEATDQRGVARPVGAACDMGAFEFSVPAAVVLVSLRATATPPWAAVVPVLALILGAAAVLAWCMGLSGAIDQADRWLWE